MARSRDSAKAAGRRFERLIADTLADQLGDDRIDRRRQTGAKDRGDIGGLRLWGQRIVIECKDTTTVSLGPWVKQADIERGNDDALAGLVAHKRRGHGDPLDQYITCTVRDLIAIVTGTRPGDPA